MRLNQDPKRARLVSVVAATIISLACGTNYVYSAWAPQFAQVLKLSSTQSNLIGTFGNLGMYASGIPFGIMVDSKGPRWGVALGIVLFGVGYYPIAKAYEAGPGVYSVAALCLFSFFTGAGSCAAFTAAIKASALNYPESRGTATAFPLAAFGLSAFFFAVVAQLIPHSTSNFLYLLAVGTVIMPVLSFYFLRVVPTHSYHHLSPHEQRVLHRTRSEETSQPTISRKDHPAGTGFESPDDSEENSSLLSRSDATVEDLENSKHTDSGKSLEEPHLDIRGFALVKHIEFWQLWFLLGLLTGIGLMTINNIGNDVQALWRHYDASADSKFIEKRQVMHVSVLSVCSFAGRLLSGIGSDMLVSKLNQSRFWCLIASSVIFGIAQILATAVQNPNFLVLISSLTGLAYGMLFGVYPSLVAHTFGVHGLSQNWGTMTLAPVVSGNIFNLLYGSIFDSHTIVEDDGTRECLIGRKCYSSAYLVTFFASIGGLVLCLWCIWHENQVAKRKMKEARRFSNN